MSPEKAHHSVTILCRCLRLTRSGFYAWQRRPESAHAADDRRLRVLVRTAFTEGNWRGAGLGAHVRAPGLRAIALYSQFGPLPWVS